MKVKELIELIKDYPEHNITIITPSINYNIEDADAISDNEVEIKASV